MNDLSADEAAGIDNVLAEIDAQTPKLPALLHYIVHPPVEWVCDRVTGTRRFRKFSCSGFVLEAYEKGAKIRLVDTDQRSLPPVEFATIVSVYGQIVENGDIRARIGIAGSGPWPIVMAGYLIRSLDRSPEMVRTSPYLPTSDAEATACKAIIVRGSP